MIGETLKDGHLENVRQLLKGPIIFIQKANFNKGQKTSGLLEIELLLLKELTTLNLKVSHAD